ncbi:MAG: hypothetical protein IT337_14195 [Thermomicrobiales bacterium]|nr:hypothetical protein [Thermomicrobiales bacterium]
MTHQARPGAVIIALVYLIVGFQIARAAWAVLSGGAFPSDAFIATFVLIVMLAVFHGGKGPART